MTISRLDIESIALLLVRGQIGEANARWSRLLPALCSHLEALSPPEQALYLPALQRVLTCQQHKDWIGMFDELRFGLVLLLPSA